MAQKYPLIGAILHKYRLKIYIITGNQVHPHALITAGQSLLSGILPVDMPKITVRHLIFHKNIQYLPTLHAAIHRRVVEEDC